MLPRKTKYYSLLITLIFLQVISIIFSALTDKVRHGHYSSFVNLKSVSYWAWFFSFWSFLTSLFTIFWVIYRLISKNKQTYWIQLSDLMITVGHLVSGIVFVIGWVLLGLSSGKIKFVRPPHLSVASKTVIASLPFTAQQCWVFYQTTLHVITPILIFYFFWKFSQVDLLTKRLTRSLLLSLLSPTIYFFYVILRPIMDKNIRFKVDQKTTALTNNSGDFPSDYPFDFFYRCMGKEINKRDEYFAKYGNSLVSRILWTIVTITLGCLLFYFLAYRLIKWKKKQEEILINQPKASFF